MPTGVYVRKKNRKQTEETKRKIGDKRRGKKHSEGSRKKMSISHIGKIVSEETRVKIGNSHRGMKRPIVSEETKNKMSESHKGQICHWKGKKMLQETKDKISNTLSGRTISQNIKDKISATMKLKADKHPNWRGGVSSETEKLRSSGEYKYWRKECLKRDNFTCQKTGQSGGELAVHHINNFADFPELRFEISNGITLSKEVHKQFHKIYGKRNNTQEQMLEFITSY